MKHVLSCLFFIGCFCTVHAQQAKQKQYVEQIWIGYFNQTRISDKWGFWLDVQLRTKDNFVDSLSQFLFRPGVTYYVNDRTKLTLGYAFINHFPADNHGGISQPEHRIWQQVQWHKNAPRLRMMQWFRLEERFRRKIKDEDELAEGYVFNFRLRYNFFVQGPIGKKAFQKGAFSWVLNDELMINFGKQVVYNTFDQNRFFAGFNYYLNKRDNIQFGYMNILQQLPSGNQYRIMNGGRVFFFHNLDFRKSNKG